MKNLTQEKLNQYVKKLHKEQEKRKEYALNYATATIRMFRAQTNKKSTLVYKTQVQITMKSMLDSDSRCLFYEKVITDLQDKLKMIKECNNG